MAKVIRFWVQDDCIILGHFYSPGGSTSLGRRLCCTLLLVYFMCLGLNFISTTYLSVGARPMHGLVIYYINCILAQMSESMIFSREFSTPPSGVNTPNFCTTPPASSPDNPL